MTLELIPQEEKKPEGGSSLTPLQRALENDSELQKIAAETTRIQKIMAAATTETEKNAAEKIIQSLDIRKSNRQKAIKDEFYIVKSQSGFNNDQYKGGNSRGADGR
jgi:hypothetical protein